MTHIISGTQQRAASLSPSAIDFGNGALNTQTVARPVLLTNTGLEDLCIKRLVAVGDFVDLTQPLPVLKPGESVQLWVAFKPGQLGQLNGGLYVDTGNAAGQEFVHLAGSGVPNGGTIPVAELEALIHETGDERYLKQSDAESRITGVGDERYLQLENTSEAVTLIGDQRYMRQDGVVEQIEQIATNALHTALETVADDFVQLDQNLADIPDKAAARENIEVVSYAEQALTPSQQAQVRENIEAASYAPQTLTQAQQAQLRENIGLGGEQTYFGPVAGPTRLNTNFSATNKQMNSYQSFRLKTACKAMTLAFPNWYIDASNNEVPAGAAATITASIEYPIGVFTKVTFNGGANSGSIPSGGTLLSDAISVDMPDGAFFRVRTYVTCTAGVVFSNAPGEAVSGQSGNEQAASGSTDKTLSGAAIVDSTNVYAPIAILGQTDKPSIALHGDSRVWGSGDSADGSQDSGSLQRSLSNRFAVVNLAKSGDRSAKFLAGNARRRAVANYCSHIILEYGVNDMRSDARTAAQVRADNEAIIALYPDKPVLVTTIEPHGTSTDSFATLANQTTHATNGQRVTYNGWVRSGLAGAAGYIELADAVESSRDSGKWKVTGLANGYTADGLHATRAGYLLVPESSAIDQNVFLPLLTKELQFASMKQMQLGKANNLLVSPALVFGEFGEFLPRVIGSTAEGTATYTIQRGVYRKIGNLVFFNIALNWSGHTGTGTLYIGDLPYNQYSYLPAACPYNITYTTLDYTAGAQILAASNTAGDGKRIRIYQQTPGANATGVPMDAAAFISITGFYFTAD